jgi:hypothetical protein
LELRVLDFIATSPQRSGLVTAMDREIHSEMEDSPEFFGLLNQVVSQLMNTYDS